MLSHETGPNETVCSSIRGRRRLGPSTDTSSIIGGIDTSERWKTTAQLHAEGQSVQAKGSRKKMIKSAGTETFEFGVTPIERLRKQLHQRGSRGIVGLSRKFRSIDDDGSNSLSVMEFRKAIKEYGLDFTDPEITELFNLFDVDRNGSINCTEFLTKIRGKLNDRRRRLIQLAFEKIDRDSSGILDFADIKDIYNSGHHPDVLSGKRSHKEVLTEFLETFEVGGEIDGKVTLQEFENYYANISSSIDNDDYFELMIRNAWHISGGEGWAANSANRRVLVTRADGTQAVEEIEDDLGVSAGNKEAMIARLRLQGSAAAQVDVTGGVEVEDSRRTRDSAKTITTKGNRAAYTSSSGAYGTNLGLLSGGNEITLGRPGSASYQKLSESVSSTFGGKVTRKPASTQAPPYVSSADGVTANHPVLLQLKNQLISRGAIGIVGLSRAFKRMDFNGNKSLNFEEFSRALIETGMKLTQPQQRQLFIFFDKDRSGCISYNEFLTALRGTLNKRRKELVSLAFKKLDKSGRGSCGVQDVISIYDASKHPDVISGTKTVGQVLTEFLETFEVGGEIDGKVTLQEFENYYANISSSIDNDDYFELMIRNAWHISGGEGWAANSANRRVLVTRADGTQAVEEIEDDLGVSAGNKEAMIARLRLQGSAAAQVDVTGGVEVEDSRRTRDSAKTITTKGNRAAYTSSSSLSSSFKPDLRIPTSTRVAEELLSEEGFVSACDKEGLVARLRRKGTIARNDRSVKSQQDKNRPKTHRPMSVCIRPDEAAAADVAVGSGLRVIRSHGGPKTSRERDSDEHESPEMDEFDTQKDSTTGVFVGMTLPGGYVVKGFQDTSAGNGTSFKDVLKSSIGNSTPPRTSLGKNTDREDQAQLGGRDIEKLRNLKARAFTCYVRNDIAEAEKKYLEILQVVLQLNNYNKLDPEYIRGIHNVNKCRQKLGRSLLDDSGEEMECIDEW